MAKQFNYAAYQQRLEALEEKTRKLLRDSGNKDLESQMNAALVSASDQKKLRIAFVGQYSSGKSTIISALTGDKTIKIDANVATDKKAEYPWGKDIILVDTPGILAGKMESHDEETKKALRECDLIFYVLTSQLFDDVIFNNFIDLAFEQHFADKMFVIVNKMGMEAGDYEVLVSNYTASIEKTFSERGYDFNKFPIAFIDAYDYIDGIDEKDEEFVELSRFERFIDMLNTFVSKKGMIKKQFDTPVRVLQSYLKDIKVSAIDKTLCDFYNQFERKLNSSQTEIKRDINNVLYSFDSSAMSDVIKLAGGIGSMDEAEWKQQQNELNGKLMNLISNTSAQIETTINQNYENLLKEMNEFSEKDALVQYSKGIDDKINSPNISIEEKENLTMQKKSLELLRQGGTKVSGMAPGVDKLFGGISGASGSQLHEIVLNVGHFFGKSFKPWEAVRWASNIAKFAKFGIPVITAGIDIWMQIREDNKENQRLQQIKDSKSQFITAYQSELNRIKDQFVNYMYSILQNYNNKRDEINRSKEQLLLAAQKNDKLNKDIKELEGEYVDFIEIIDNE